MSLQGYVFPSFVTALGAKGVDLASDTLQALLIASASPAVAARSVSQNWQHVSEFLANNGSALTEVSDSGTNYSRQTLTGVSFSGSGLVNTLTCDDVIWANGTFSATYALFFDDTVGGTDATNQLIAYWDFGGTESVAGQTFVLRVSESGLVYWTAAQ